MKISANSIRINAEIIRLQNILANNEYYIFEKDCKDNVEEQLRVAKKKLAAEYIMEDKGLDFDRAYALAQDFEKQGLLEDFIRRSEAI